MEKYLIESKVNEVRMHTISINGAPCVVSVFPGGTIEIAALSIKVAEPKRVKAVKQPKQGKPARKVSAPVAPNPERLMPNFNPSAFLAKFKEPAWMR